MVLRILIGFVVLVVIVLAVKQSNKRAPASAARNSAPAAQKIGKTFTSAENGYSHRIPQGWETKTAGASKEVTIAAPESSGLSSNMVTTVEPYGGTLSAYVDEKIQPLKKSAVKAKVKRADFVTDAKTGGYKVKLQNKTNDVDVGQTMYFFDGTGDKKIVVTCTAPAELSAQLEPLFDGCMKTFTLSPP